MQSLEHVRGQACTDKLEEEDGTQKDPIATCSLEACRQRGEHNRMDVTQNKKQQQLEQQEQKKEETSKQDGPKQHNNNNNNLGTNYIGSFEREEQEAMSLYRILVDTGAETSVAPRSFADHIPLSFSQNDLKLRGADGKSIHILGTREVELVTMGFSFTTFFVIADVERPLLGLQSLLQNNLSLQLDRVQGHQLVNLEGEKIPLQQLGQQIFLAACPLKMELTPNLTGSLQMNSLMPENKLEEPSSLELRQHREMPKKGGATGSFTLENLGHLRQQANKTAIGQQQALPKQAKEKKNKKLGQGAANKLRPLAKTRIINEIQLALLHPKQDPTSLDHATAQEISFRVVLTWSLMNKWQLLTTRIPKAEPQKILGQLRKLGLDQCSLDTHLLLGDHLFVMLDGINMLVGGQKQDQECLLTELSALMTLECTTKLEDSIPLNFLGRSVELNQAERSISLQVPSALYKQLLEQHGEEDAQATSSLEELYSTASSFPSRSLNAERTKLYRKTVGSLNRLALTRPDAAFAIQQLRRSLARPTEHDEVQLRKVLGYLRRTQAYTIKLQPTRRWNKATSLELLAYASTSSTAAWKSSFGVSLFLLGVPLIASSRTQATRVEAAELQSVKLACKMAAFTKILLQQLGFQKHVSLKVLTGGSLAKQLGLSKHLRHVQLHSCFGQFQLSKVLSHQDLTAKLTYNPPACELHRLLPKLKMHNQTAEEGALTTVLSAEEGAFLLGGPSSFYIGVVSLTPAMEQLDLAMLERTGFGQLTLTAYATQLGLDKLERIELNQLDDDKLERIDLVKLEQPTLGELQPAYASQLLGKEDAKQLDLNQLELQLALPPQISLQEDKLSEEELERTASTKSLQQQPFQKGACETGVDNGSTRARDQQRRAFSPLTLPSLVLALVILMLSFILSSLTLWSLSLSSNLCSLTCYSLSFPELRQNKLQTAGLGEEIAENLELANLLWDQELAKFLAHKSFQLGSYSFRFHIRSLDPQLGSYRFRFHIRSLDSQLGSYRFRFHIRSLDSQFGSYSFRFHIRSLDPQLGSYSFRFHIRSLDPQLGSYSFRFHIRSLDPQLGSYSLSFHIRSLDKKNFQSLISEKLVALLLKKHFASAASSQLLGYEAWGKYREASADSFEKVGDKELLQEELRQEELGCKDLRPAYFRALCPTSFEENSFHKKSFDKNSFAENSFQQGSFATSTFKEGSLAAHSFDKKSFEKHSFDKKSFEKHSFDKKSFEKHSFDTKSFEKHSFDTTSLEKHSFAKKSFDKDSFDKKSFDKESFDKKSFDKKSFDRKSFAENSFEKNSFNPSSLEESSFSKSSFPTSSLRGSSFNQKSLAEKSFHTSSFTYSSLEESSFSKSGFQKSSLEASSFNKRSFEESSFSTSSLEESSFTSSFEQSSLQLNSFDTCSFEQRSLTSELSKPELGQLKSPALKPQLDEAALKKAASSFELHTAHFAERSFRHLCGVKPQDCLTPRGSAKGKASLPQLTQLDLELVPGFMLGSSLPDASIEREASLPLVSKISVFWGLLFFAN